jgi:hypothetical protein
MSFGSRRINAGVLLAALVVAGCGQAAASHPGGQSPPPRAKHSPTRPAKPIDRMTAVARALYAEQVAGPHSLAVLHRLGSDPNLLRLLASGDVGSVRAYVSQRYPSTWYHWHVSRMRISRGSQVVSEVGVRFVMPASRMALHGSGGRTLGTLQVSMQDEIGFVRLMHRRYSVNVVIRGRGQKHLRASDRAAGLANLPATGSVVLGGRRYFVRSFHENAWGGERVTIWILMKA